MPKIYTIAQVLATPEGQYVSAEVFATLQNPQPPRGKGPWTATLEDSTGHIVGKFWGGDISYWAGKRMKLSGKGMQRKGYNGVPELSVGQTVSLSFAGAPGTAVQEEETMPGDPQETLPPPPRYNPAPKPQPPRQNAPTASGTRDMGNPRTGEGYHDGVRDKVPRNGQTVGMVCKAAVDIWIATEGPASAGGFGPAQLAQIEKIAQSLFEMSERVQAGPPDSDDDHNVPF